MALTDPWSPDYRQEPPFCLQIELTLGCNLRCSFCGINGGPADGPGSDLRFMTHETAEVVASRIAATGWNPRIEFARRGEPSLHPDPAGIIEIFRRYNPTLQLQMTTNGGGLLRKPGAVENVRFLFNAGLNLLAIDDYAVVRLGDRVRDALGCPRDRITPSVPALPGIERREHPTDPESHPNHRYRPGTRKIIFLADPERTEAARLTLNNHAGFGASLRSYPKPCVKPFREVGINYDGSIDLCCIDWISEYRIGNLYDRSLESIWLDPAFEAARRFLIRGQRDKLRPCAGCDHPGYNTNWLPGKGGRGRKGYPEPTAADLATVTEMNLRGPVERPAARAMTNVYPSLTPELRRVWDQRRGE